MRQTHHWAALVFVAAIVMHLMRIFFTGAFRKPRDLNYFVGLTMLILAVLEGYVGYSLLDDLLSGMGLQIGNGVALSIPVVGADVSTLIWGGQFPGDRRLPVAPVHRACLHPAGADRDSDRGPSDSRCPSPSHPVPRPRTQ